MNGIVSAVCSVIVFSSFSFVAADECTTPNQQAGNCKVINDCSVLYKILQHRPIPSASADYLRRSHCGFQGTLPKVCCPNESTPPPTSRPPIDDDDVYDRNHYNNNNNHNNHHNGDIATTSSATPVSSDLLPDGSTCGIDSQNRIYGGETADLDEFPWMALIEYEKPNGKRGFYCGGVLINNRYVLTAAHCLKGKDLPRNWKLVSVRLGEYNTETERDCVSHGQGYGEDCAPPPLNIPVSERIAHEDYDPYDQNQYNDIALLRLTKDVPFSDFVSPICLPKTSEELGKTYTGKKLFVAGWGKTENASESAVKLKLQVPVRSNSDCSSIYNVARVKLGQGQLCAGGIKGRDSCRGDSGGPLMTISADKNGEINWYAAGIVSFGPSPCGMENWPGVYTRVNKYVPWIVNKVQP